MLTKFCVTGFKGFKDKLVFDLSRAADYTFNTEAVQNGIVSKGLLYGFNGCGKSNLGLALFDIVSHLTDMHCPEISYLPYRNLDTPPNKLTEFEYQFVLDGISVKYFYRKKGLKELLFESLQIDNKKVLEYDFNSHRGFVSLAGTESMNLEAPDSNLSRVKYVKSNSILSNSPESQAFIKFTVFVDHMLLFYSLERNSFSGFKADGDTISAAIIRENKVKEFEQFLHESNIDLNLEAKEIDGLPELIVHYKNGSSNFFNVASRGTTSLALFFYWYIQMSKASFVFIDEFDAFYHYELSERIVNLLKRPDMQSTQCILTTHNTDLLTNDLLRPDCFFWMNEGKISPLCELTEKELRQAHNLQKMFKAGAFCV